MPTYNIREKATGKIISTMDMTISELEKFERKNPKLEAAIGQINLGYNVATRKPDDGFRDLLKNIKKNNIRSNIETY
jgi:hypothetical protein